ncbi:MAG: deoxyribose-phosphate aldolase [Clostridia bacterium]|nr:deoxyribose-phosphate aldolase [Clostridia bacterium]
MDIKEILSKVDHTLLRVDARYDEITALIDDAVKYGCASVCIPPSYVKSASEYAGGKIKICTVIGFPNGYNVTAVKCAEAEDAVKNGADEIDMVINVGMVKNGRFDDVQGEIRAVKAACGGKLLKVIIETCLLTEEEKIRMCQVVSESGADYIKTSTGFAGGGATAADVALMARHVTGGLKIKAAGGISTISDAEEFICLGESRLGTSRIVSIVKKEENSEAY